MKKMQTAMQKGFKQATGAWGKDLPDICQKTLDAANQKFEDIISPKRAQQRPKAENRLLQPGDCLQKKGKNTGKRGVFSLLFSVSDDTAMIEEMMQKWYD